MEAAVTVQKKCPLAGRNPEELQRCTIYMLLNFQIEKREPINRPSVMCMLSSFSPQHVGNYKAAKINTENVRFERAYVQRKHFRLSMWFRALAVPVVCSLIYQLK